ncbi:unnamed protein product [Plutella xylostella]|uniref:(diamondback moth) hypothetical protein n=1 Tax=Plutella xylostella TaxID=51655 RepID=A0A8S4F505_PLUXY|nr:unnamed protein product [Plutella xylostella]
MSAVFASAWCNIGAFSCPSVMLVWLALLLGAAGGAGDEARGPHCTSPLCHLQGVSLNEYVFNIDGSNESVSVEWVPGEYLAVRCARDVAGGAAAMPALPPAAAAPRAALAACAAPAPALRRLRLPPPPRLSLLALPADPLDADYFAGLEAVSELRLSAAPPAAPPLLPGALAALPALHTLRTDGVQVQLDALPAALRVLSVRGGGGGGVRAGWGAARAALRRLVLAPAGDAGGLGGAPSLQVLELESVSALWVGALPALENVTLRGLAVVRGGELAGSARLRALRVEGGAAGSLPARWLAGLPALRSVLLRRLPLRALPADLLADSPALQVLEVSRCSLQSLPPALLRGQARLAELLLDHNNITYLDPEVFSGTSSLVSLSLTHNALSSLSFLARLPALRRLRADDNPLGDTCGEPLSSLSPLRHCPALREAGLARSGAARLCADWRLLLTRLAVLDLRGNNYTDLQVCHTIELPLRRASTGRN